MANKVTLKIRHLCDDCGARFELTITAKVVDINDKPTVVYVYVIMSPHCPQCGSGHLRMLNKYYNRLTIR